MKFIPAFVKVSTLVLKSDSGGAHQGEQGGGALVAEGEDSCYLAVGGEGVQRARREGTKGEFVFELVAQGGYRRWVRRSELGSGLRGDRCGSGASTRKGPRVLDVAEVVVPDKLSDLRVPGHAQSGEKGTGRKLIVMRGARAGGDAGEVQRRVRWAAGGAEAEQTARLFDAGLLPGGHKAREVFGVGEEGEDEFNWETEATVRLGR